MSCEANLKWGLHNMWIYSMFNFSSSGTRLLRNDKQLYSVGNLNPHEIRDAQHWPFCKITPSIYIYKRNDVVHPSSISCFSKIGYWFWIIWLISYITVLTHSIILDFICTLRIIVGMGGSYAQQSVCNRIFMSVKNDG